MTPSRKGRHSKPSTNTVCNAASPFWGSRGRGFESRHPDQSSTTESVGYGRSLRSAVVVYGRVCSHRVRTGLRSGRRWRFGLGVKTIECARQPDRRTAQIPSLGRVGNSSSAVVPSSCCALSCPPSLPFRAHLIPAQGNAFNKPPSRMCCFERFRRLGLSTMPRSNAARPTPEPFPKDALPRARHYCQTQNFNRPLPWV